MCELFGISSRKKVLCNELLKKFYANSVNHPDGWGLAAFYQNSVSVEKEPLSASMSLYLENRLTDEIEEDVLLAHIRKASVGSLVYKNSHPFAVRDHSDRMWTLIHNGTVFESELLDVYKKKQKGQCDSERVLLYFVDCINQKQEEAGRLVDAGERFAVIDQALHRIVPKNKLNLLLYDGELLYVHMNHPDSLHSSHCDGGFVFSTQPLDDGHWDCVPINTLLAFRQGELVCTGIPHDFTFLKEEDIGRQFDPRTSPDIYYL